MNREYDLQNCWTKSGDGFSNCVYFSQGKWTEILNQVCTNVYIVIKSVMLLIRSMQKQWILKN